jgi:hypothetical protein
LKQFHITFKNVVVDFTVELHLSLRCPVVDLPKGPKMASEFEVAQQQCSVGWLSFEEKHLKN